jgi:hypothetical protein
MLKGRKRESFQLERAVQNKEDSQEGTDTLLGDDSREKADVPSYVILGGRTLSREGWNEGGGCWAEPKVTQW